MNKLILHLIVLSLMLSSCNVIDTNSIKSSDNDAKSVVSEQNTIPENEKNSIESKQESTLNDTIELVKEPIIEGIEAFEGDLDIELESNVTSLFKNLFIGEMNKSGFVYIEPFRVNRGAGGTGELKYKNYPSSIQFYSIDDECSIFTAIFDSESNIYIPSIEEGSLFYNQGFDESNQSVLCYKTSVIPDDELVGITVFNYEIENIDFSIRGNERVYIESEYNDSLINVNETNKINGSDEGILREITLDDTIIGAKQVCLISIKDVDIKILLSKYMTVGYESTADVYVIDFIKDGKVIQTIEKYNGVSY